MRAPVLRISIAIALAALLTPLAAQVLDRPMPLRWWRMARARQHLGLTAQQQGQIESVFVGNRKKLIDLRAELEKKGLDLQTLVESESPDENAIRRQVQTIYETKGEIETLQILMRLKIKSILTPEQQTKLEELQRNVSEQRGPRRLEPQRNPE